MMTCIEATFYKDRNNSALLTLTNNGVIVPTANVDKIEFTYDGGSIDSDTDPALFSFGTESIRLKFGQSDLSVGVYEMALIVYGTDYPDGIVWDQSIKVEMR